MQRPRCVARTVPAATPCHRPASTALRDDEGVAWFCAQHLKSVPDWRTTMVDWWNQVDVDAVDENLATVRARLRALQESPFAAAADAVFDNDPRHVARWLRLVADDVRAGRILGGNARRLSVEALHLDLNEFQDNPDAWRLTPSVCGARVEPDGPVYRRSLDVIVGAFVGDVLAPSLSLAGMEEVQFLFARHYPDRAHDPDADLAVALVTLSVYQLVDRALRLERPGLRVAVEAHDTAEYAVWE